MKGDNHLDIVNVVIIDGGIFKSRRNAKHVDVDTPGHPEFQA